jgi:hypothetical protein
MSEIEYPPKDVYMKWPEGKDKMHKGNEFVRRGRNVNLVLPPDEGRGLGNPRSEKTDET